MSFDFFKNKVVLFLLGLGLLLIVIFQGGLYRHNAPTLPTEPEKTAVSTNTIDVVSTNPNPLENATLAPTQTIEITFTQPIENEGELKYDFDPKADASVKLSDDRKTAKITPQTPFLLGTSYTLFIRGNTKFDGKKTLGQDKIFHFSTISYKGV